MQPSQRRFDETGHGVGSEPPAPCAVSETSDIVTSSDDYAKRFSGPIGTWFLQEQERATLRMLARFNHTGAKILDVGGGHGQLTHALVQHGYQVTVLGSADVCKRRIQHLLDAKQCLFRVGKLLDLPYSNQSFDIVVSFRLLPHVTLWQQLVSELTRVASRVVMVDYPALGSVNYFAPLLFRLKERLESNTRPFTCFREAELLDVFHTCGFQRAARHPEFFLPMVLHRCLRVPGLSAGLEKMCRRSGLTELLGSPIILQLVRESG